MQKTAVISVILLFLLTACLRGVGFGFSMDDTSFKGDLRLRYQYEKAEDEAAAAETTRHRERVRFRLGFETAVSNILNVGMRLASGSDDPRSTNQTLENSFSSKNIHLDRTYLEFVPRHGISLRGGKFNDALVSHDDLLWDSDITFEGQAIGVAMPLADGLLFTVNGGMFLLDETKTSGSDPHMFAAQPTVALDLGGTLSAEFGIAYYAFSHVQGAVLDHSAGTNAMSGTAGTLNGAGLRYDYDSVNPSAAIDFVFEKSDGTGYRVRMIGDFIYNPDAEESGYLAGLGVGHAQTKHPGSWEVSYTWRRLERDAFLDVFPDSDFYGGKTGVAGHEVVLNYTLAKHFTFGVDYYRAWKIDGDEDPQDLLQVDWVVKF